MYECTNSHPYTCKNSCAQLRIFNARSWIWALALRQSLIYNRALSHARTCAYIVERTRPGHTRNQMDRNARIGTHPWSHAQSNGQKRTYMHARRVTWAVKCTETHLYARTYSLTRSQMDGHACTY